MEMILLDWTRMGKGYCLAGAVMERGHIRIVRPLLLKGRAAEAHRVGWSPYLLDGYMRWEVFQLIGADPAICTPPHMEDLWVRTLKPLGRLAEPALRRRILTETTAPETETPFGAAFEGNHASAHLTPGTGTRSLATITVAAEHLRFEMASRTDVREGAMRVRIPLPGGGVPTLPVTDHHLRTNLERAFPMVRDRIDGVTKMVAAMGERLAVRLGVSRPFSANGQETMTACWVMANGFFSLAEPQP